MRNDLLIVTNDATHLTLQAPEYGLLHVLCEALAEGEHELGDEVTQAAYAVIQWAGADCPWFQPRPEVL